jgi:hypothetical protein
MVLPHVPGAGHLNASLQSLPSNNKEAPEDEVTLYGKLFLEGSMRAAGLLALALCHCVQTKTPPSLDKSTSKSTSFGSTLDKRRAAKEHEILTTMKAKMKARSVAVKHSFDSYTHHHVSHATPTLAPTVDFNAFLKGGFGTHTPTATPTTVPSFKSSWAPTPTPTDVPTSQPTKLFGLLDGMRMSGSTLYTQCTKHGRWPRATKVVNQLMGKLAKGKKMSPNTLKAIVKACIDGLESSWSEVWLEAADPTPAPVPVIPTFAPTAAPVSHKKAVILANLINKKVAMLAKIDQLKKNHGLMGPHLTASREEGTIEFELHRLEKACKSMPQTADGC